MTIYPDYETITTKTKTTLHTNIRKLHGDKYYLIPLTMHREHSSPTKLIDYRTKFIDQFMIEAYKIMVLWIINPNVIDAIYGIQIEKLDEDQRPEHERVIDNYIHYKKEL